MGELPLGNPPQLETARLTLRQPDALDVDAIVANLNDMAVAGRLSHVPFPYGETDALFFIKVIIPKQMVWGIRPKTDDALIGVVGLHGSGNSLELGYWLGTAHWGHGIATEAAHAVCGFAFDGIGTPQIVSGYHADNPASGRVLAKLGFVQTHTAHFFSAAQQREIETVYVRLKAEKFPQSS